MCRYPSPDKTSYTSHPISNGRFFIKTIDPLLVLRGCLRAELNASNDYY